MTEADILRLSALVGEQLKARGATLTCAESCTGGWLAKSITDVAGSSGWFDYGFVTYSNLAKQRLVNVSAETLERHGAVSEDVVNEMAAGALRAASADFSISVSGVAGPNGGTEDKPVGTVWFGFTDKQGGGFARKMRFSGDRNAVRLQSVHFALQTLLDAFLKK
ncbi:nicotinamide-nucleotide amidase [Pectobacterium parmentieri]|uniref:nicotinamide-nucleotide amidase n=1 Tax=Pectobacterium parmentieri TaxID=1905730 RepID=UPI000EAE519D|nr:nicotinamide-nucleotide amidase [Pectobacterium parmentieri]AYH00411.1 nicotinamide-nucleotide amidase [Pectobacterium parmentieri]AYH26648.1 nicotinamide-nucleotide amidase [Pectobacterium parmentieri]AYH31097.1 nicotinamide-nucleotide amidase [Pectobacterium parmentieri]MBI0517716.1 nicotinamide-nucleotide amidase [Pectobacterium parmentieri]